MKKYKCTIADYSFRSSDLNDILTNGIEHAENVELLAQKLLNDILKDKNYEPIQDLHYDENKDIWSAKVAFFIEIN